MKVRYETQLDQLQKEHIQLLTVVEKLQREKNLDQDIITGIQKGMANIRDTYSLDVTRWKDERQVLNNHITKVTLNTIMLNNYITKVTLNTIMLNNYITKVTKLNHVEQSYNQGNSKLNHVEQSYNKGN